MALLLLLSVLVSAAASGPSRPQVRGPQASEKQLVTFRFRSTEKGVPAKRIKYQCRLDARPFRPCRNPYRVRLSVGAHALGVRAIDPRGRMSPVRKVAVRILGPRAPEIRVGAAPLDAIAVVNTVWTENYGDGTISGVDTVTGSVRTISVGGQPGGIAYGAGSLWVSDLSGGPLARVDPAGQILARIPVGGRSAGVAVSGSTVYVADYTGGLVRVDAGSNQVLGRTALAGSPEAVAVGFGQVWVTNQNGTVSTLDPITGAMIGGPIAVGDDADGISIADESVWAVALYGRALVRIDPATHQLIARVTTPGQASGVLATGGAVWVSSYDRESVSRFDIAGNRFAQTYRVGRQPRSLAAVSGSIWVANQSSNSLSRISP